MSAAKKPARRSATKSAKSDKVDCEHPDPAKQGVRIDRDKYEAMRKALLAHIPRNRGGAPFGGLRAAIEAGLPEDVFAGASINWYLVTVKLDLEARGLIERVPKKSPQHVRRVAQRG